MRVTWDSSLNWESHLLQTYKSAHLGINMLASVCKKSWGIHPQTALTFYKTIVRPRIDWACYLFASAKKSMLQKLLQNSALRICLGSIRTTPINVLHHLAEIPTLNIRRKLIAERLIGRAYSSSASFISPKLQYIQRYLPKTSNKNGSGRISRYGLIYDSWINTSNISKNLNRSPSLPTFITPYEGLFLADKVDISWGRTCKEKSPSELLADLKNTVAFSAEFIFTDGAANKNGNKGIGYLIDSLNIVSSLIAPDQLSILSCELEAIWTGLSDPRITYDAHKIICTDSLSAALAIKDNGLNSVMHPIVSQIRQKMILDSSQDIKILIFWVPKAMKLPNCCRADQAAKEGCSSIHFSNCKPCFWDISPIFKLRSIKKMISFTSDYGNSNKGRKYVNQAKDFTLKPLFMNRADLSRGDICILNRMRSGHDRSRAHLASKGFTVEEMCECEDDLHTLYHLIWECSLINSIREKFLIKCRSLKIPKGTNKNFSH